MRQFSPKLLVASTTVLSTALVLGACGGPSNPGAASIPTYHARNYIERQIFNHRLAVSDDPSTVLFCTAYPFDAKPKTSIIAGKLVSGTKRPDAPISYDNGDSYERPDAQGMYGPSSSYRFGFSPGGVYRDYTEIPLECSTEAVVSKETAIGSVEVRDEALTRAGREAKEVLAHGLRYGPGHKFEGYEPAAQKEAQEILTRAVNASH